VAKESQRGEKKKKKGFSSIYTFSERKTGKGGEGCGEKTYSKYFPGGKNEFVGERGKKKKRRDDLHPSFGGRERKGGSRSLIQQTKKA